MQPVAHPTLPVHGVIDLLRRDAAGTHVVDFKTGTPKPEHRDQFALYALLWWRATGDLPVSLDFLGSFNRLLSDLADPTSRSRS